MNSGGIFAVGYHWGLSFCVACNQNLLAVGRFYIQRCMLVSSLIRPAGQILTLGTSRPIGRGCRTTSPINPLLLGVRIVTVSLAMPYGKCSSSAARGPRLAHQPSLVHVPAHFMSQMYLTFPTSHRPHFFSSPVLRELVASNQCLGSAHPRRIGGKRTANGVRREIGPSGL